MTAVTHPRFRARRGQVRARSWWGRAWGRAVEETAFTDADLLQARAIARSGRVGAVAVDSGRAVAAVADGDELWSVQWELPTLRAAEVDLLCELVATDPSRLAALLGGELPLRLIEEAEGAGIEVLPVGSELGAACTCPGWTDPCPHALAVAYQLGWLVDADPLVLAALRGLPRDLLLARVHTLTTPAATEQPDTADLDIAAEAALRARRLLQLIEAGETGIDHLC